MTNEEKSAELKRLAKLNVITKPQCEIGILMVKNPDWNQSGPLLETIKLLRSIDLRLLGIEQA